MPNPYDSGKTFAAGRAPAVTGSSGDASSAIDKAKFATKLLGTSLILALPLAACATPSAAPPVATPTPASGEGPQQPDLGFKIESVPSGLTTYDGFIVDPTATRITAPSLNGGGDYSFNVVLARSPGGGLLPIRFAQYTDHQGAEQTAALWPVLYRGSVNGKENLEGIQFYSLKDGSIGKPDNGTVTVSLSKNNIVRPFYSLFFKQGKTYADFQKVYHEMVMSGKGSDPAAVQALVDQYVDSIAIADPNAANEAEANQTATVLTYTSQNRDLGTMLVSFLSGADPVMAASTDANIKIQVTPTAPAGPTAAPTAEASPTPAAPKSLDELAKTQPNAELIRSVETKYVPAMAVRGVTAENIVPEVRMEQGAAGQFAVVVDKNTGVPLLISAKDGAGNWSWQEATPGNIGTAKWGMEVSVDYGNVGVPGMREDALKFNGMYISYDTTWAFTEPKQGEVVYQNDSKWAYSDHEMQYAMDHGLPVMMGQLISTGQYPDWLEKGINDGSLKPDQVREIVRNRITGMMQHFNDKSKNWHVNTWVVVNEFHPLEWKWGPDALQTSLGDYREFCYQVAREADPNATLLINDGGNESPDLGSYTYDFQEAKSLHDKGLIDGVGLQMHLMYFNKHIPTYQELLTTFNTYKKLGVPVYVTEFDVNMTNVTGSDADFKAVGIDPSTVPAGLDQNAKRLLIHDQIVRNVVKASVESQNVKTISFFAMGDQYSWLKDTRGPNADGTLFDNQLNPKAAYYGAIRELLGDKTAQTP